MSTHDPQGPPGPGSSSAPIAPIAPIEALFDQLAAEYDELRREVGWDPWPHLDEFLGRGPLTGRAILDVGCATGEVCQRLIRRGAQVTGLDVSAQMCALARQRAPRARIIRHDLNVSPLPVEPSSFDHVLALGCLEFCHDLEGTLRELVGALRPGGTLLGVIELCGPGRLGGQARVVSLYEQWRRYRMTWEQAEALVRAHLEALTLDEVPGYLQDEHGQGVRYMRVMGARPLA